MLEAELVQLDVSEDQLFHVCVQVLLPSQGRVCFLRFTGLHCCVAGKH
jgi:hypothetical protein